MMDPNGNNHHHPPLFVRIKKEEREQDEEGEKEKQDEERRRGEVPGTTRIIKTETEMMEQDPEVVLCLEIAQGRAVEPLTVWKKVGIQEEVFEEEEEEEIGQKAFWRRKRSKSEGILY